MEMQIDFNEVLITGVMSLIGYLFHRVLLRPGREVISDIKEATDSAKTCLANSVENKHDHDEIIELLEELLDELHALKGPDKSFKKRRCPDVSRDGNPELADSEVRQR
jgi:hypothetical protein